MAREAPSESPPLHKLSNVAKGPIILSLGKFQGFRSSYSGARDKGLTSLGKVKVFTVYPFPAALMHHWCLFSCCLSPVGCRLLELKLTGCVMEWPRARSWSQAAWDAISALLCTGSVTSGIIINYSVPCFPYLLGGA